MITKIKQWYNNHKEKLEKQKQYSLDQVYRQQIGEREWSKYREKMKIIFSNYKDTTHEPIIFPKDKTN